MSRKLMILIATMVLLGIAAVFYWLLHEPDYATRLPEEIRKKEQRDEPSASGGTKHVQGDDAIQEMEKELIPAEVLKEPETTSEKAETESSGRIKLTGTITVTDEHGKEHTGESGSFDFVLWQGNSGTHQEVEVVDGHWSTTVPKDQLLSVDAVFLGGSSAVLTAPVTRYNKFPVPESGFIALRAQWQQPSILRVKGADTGMDLDGIELVSGVDLSSAGGVHPGSYTKENVVLSSASSPINLTRTVPRKDQWNSDYYFARSPGYAWGSIEIDHDLGGERILTLERGGGLEVELSGYDPESRAALRLRWDVSGFQPALLNMNLVTEDRVRIDSLAAGRYRVSVEIGDSWRDRVVLAEGTVEIIPGAWARIKLALDSAPRAAMAPLKGILVVPEAWGFDHFHLAVELLDAPLEGNPDRQTFSQDDLEPLAGWEDAFSWDAGLVQAGRYELNVDPPEYSISVEVPPEGLTDVRIEVPPPEEVIVRIIDASTGEDAAIDSLHWHPKRPEWVSGGGVKTVDKDPKTGRFAFQAPRGEICVSAWKEAYSNLHAILTIRPGDNIHTLEVQPACGILLTLKDGGTTIPWSTDWDVTAMEVGGEGTTVAWSYKPPNLFLKLSKPGLYRFTVPQIDGYLPLPEQEVPVAPGEKAVHLIRLKRKP